MSALTIETHGAALHAGAALSILSRLEAILADTPAGQAGTRLYGIPP